MKKEEFEQLVDEGITAIGEEFLKLANNVAIVIEDEPSADQRRKMRLGRGHTLLGLYEGIPQTSRQHYGVGTTLPDRITIFRKPIEAIAGDDPVRIREMVAETVWHEIAHHFGMDERRVRKIEGERRKRQK